jgi:hypothetical protein
MTDAINGKIQTLLEQAAIQNDSATPDDSSIVKATRVFSTAAEAEKAFSFLRERLLQIERWNVFSEISSFALFGENGNPQPDKLAAVGDFIKVTLPGSGKDDWVKISRIDELPDEFVLTVQPSHDPTEGESKQTTSHFFTGDSTNNFCLQRVNARINFYVIGLNEKTNTEETNGILEIVRNLATANIGCLLGIQKTQWETFCKNFLEGEKSEKVKE